MRKAWIKFCVAAFFLSGCQPTVTLDRQQLAENTRQVFEQLQSGDFSAVVARMDEKLAAQVNETVLKNKWHQMVSQLGEYRGIDIVDVQQRQKQWLCTLRADYEHQGLQLSAVVQRDGTITGIQLDFSARIRPMEETEFYQEVLVQIETQLTGKLTLPKQEEQPPVVIVFHGSRQHDMDGAGGDDTARPLADLAHALAQRGIATLRYSSSRDTDPWQAEAQMTIETEVLEAVDEAIRLVGEMDSVNNRQIFVAGHGLGGMLIPRIAADHPELSGVISLAGTLRPADEVLADQLAAQVESESAMTEEEKQAALSQYALELKRIRQLEEKTPSQMILGQPSGYWYSLNQACGMNYLDALQTMPILVLQGEKDTQITTEADYSLWQTALEEYPQAEFKLYPALDHWFMPDPTSAENHDEAERHVSEEVADDIAAWIETLQNQPGNRHDFSD